MFFQNNPKVSKYLGPFVIFLAIWAFKNRPNLVSLQSDLIKISSDTERCFRYNGFYGEPNHFVFIGDSRDQYYNQNVFVPQHTALNILQD